MELKRLKRQPCALFAGLQNAPNRGGVVGVVTQRLNSINQRIDRAVAALVRDGYHVVIVGRRDHVEVRGLTGDLGAFADCVFLQRGPHRDTGA